jgi:3-phenylpropionate/trans-cinnamate dioxygenase ferredoxin subunit
MTSGWVDVGASAALSENVPLAVELEGAAVVIVRCENGTLYAVEAPVENCQIICPRHGAHFCLRTGEALTPPAYEPLRSYSVRERGSRIELELPA